MENSYSRICPTTATNEAVGTTNEKRAHQRCFSRLWPWMDPAHHSSFLATVRKEQTVTNIFQQLAWLCRSRWIDTPIQRKSIESILVVVVCWDLTHTVGLAVDLPAVGPILYSHRPHPVSAVWVRIDRNECYRRRTF